MDIVPGSIISSAAGLQDPNFEKAVIVIIESNENGVTGFVINKLFERTLNELTEFINSKPFPLYAGGPVDREGIFLLHQRTDLIKDGKHAFGRVYMGGDFQQVIACINTQMIDHNDIKLFIGYCGWNKGELEAEIEEGSWILHEPGTENIFNNTHTR
jgi:putative transcriptional regulator